LVDPTLNKQCRRKPSPRDQLQYVFLERKVMFPAMTGALIAVQDVLEMLYIKMNQVKVNQVLLVML